eukprot:3067067-Pyramimonas_sp.AAC.1
MLDWSKAFDRLKPDCMRQVLERFGVPQCFVNMVESIYAARYFIIVDHTGHSSHRQQRAGIAQGCPLSPYLFIIIQTVMLHDAFGDLHLQQEPAYLGIARHSVCRRHFACFADPATSANNACRNNGRRNEIRT